jgi:hypothetical protein
MKSATLLSGMRTNLPTFTKRMRRSRTHRSMKRTDTENASAASAFVSNRSRPGLPPRVRRAGRPLARSTARLGRVLTHPYRGSASQSAANKFSCGPNDLVAKLSPHTPAPADSCTRQEPVGGIGLCPPGGQLDLCDDGQSLRGCDRFRGATDGRFRGDWVEHKGTRENVLKLRLRLDTSRGRLRT